MAFGLGKNDGVETRVKLSCSMTTVRLGSVRFLFPVHMNRFPVNLPVNLL